MICINESIARLILYLAGLVFLGSFFIACPACSCSQKIKIWAGSISRFLAFFFCAFALDSVSGFLFDALTDYQLQLSGERIFHKFYLNLCLLTLVCLPLWKINKRYMRRMIAGMAGFYLYIFFAAAATHLYYDYLNAHHLIGISRHPTFLDYF